MPATPRPAASSPTPRTSSAPRSPRSRRASKRSSANNLNGPSATASKPQSLATANVSAASSTTSSDSPAWKPAPAESQVDLAAIARPLVDDARSRAPRAAITLSANGGATVRGDPDALERVLRNLIDNALAAIDPTGRIDVQLHRRRRLRPERSSPTTDPAYPNTRSNASSNASSDSTPANPVTALASPSPVASRSNTTATSPVSQRATVPASGSEFPSTSESALAQTTSWSRRALRARTSSSSRG